MHTRSLLVILAVTATIAALVTEVAATVERNAKIVFVSNRDGNNELYVMNRDGSGQIRLTHTPEAEASPAASPDGRTIAFLKLTSSAGYLIHLMDRDGTNVRPIPGAHADGPLSWSPDGNRIAFAQNARIQTIRTDGSERIVLSPGQVADYSPSWSSDGSSIAFVRFSLPSGANGIFRMQSDGGGAVPVALHYFNYASFSDPSWSPDGDRIVFTYPSAGDLASNDSIAYAENDVITPIIEHAGPTPAYRYGPKYSPDGQDLLFYEGLRDTGPFQITLLTRVLTDRSSSNFSPDWLPMPTTVSISGRVTTPEGTGLRNARVVLSDDSGTRRIATTGSFGTFAFDDIQPGRQYTVSVSSKRYSFQIRTVTPSDNITGFDFTALEKAAEGSLLGS